MSITTHHEPRDTVVILAQTEPREYQVPPGFEAIAAAADHEMALVLMEDFDTSFALVFGDDDES